MVRTMQSRATGFAVAVIAACALLAGCATPSDGSAPGGFGPGGAPGDADSHVNSSGGHGNDANPQQTNPGKSSGDTNASCLIGTWQEDLTVLTREMNKALGISAGSPPKMKWSGGAFLRFDDRGLFYHSSEDSVYESWIAGHHRSVVNAAVTGDYAADNGVIRWSNASTLFNDTIAHTDGSPVDSPPGDLAESYRHPSPFSCTKDKLIAHMGSSELMIPREFDRIPSRAKTMSPALRG